MASIETMDNTNSPSWGALATAINNPITTSSSATTTAAAAVAVATPSPTSASSSSRSSMSIPSVEPTSSRVTASPTNTTTCRSPSPFASVKEGEEVSAADNNNDDKKRAFVPAEDDQQGVHVNDADEETTNHPTNSTTTKNKRRRIVRRRRSVARRYVPRISTTSQLQKQESSVALPSLQAQTDGTLLVVYHHENKEQAQQQYEFPGRKKENDPTNFASANSYSVGGSSSSVSFPWDALGAPTKPAPGSMLIPAEVTINSSNMAAAANSASSISSGAPKTKKKKAKKAEKPKQAVTLTATRKTGRQKKPSQKARAAARSEKEETNEPPSSKKKRVKTKKPVPKDNKKKRKKPSPAAAAASSLLPQITSGDVVEVQENDVLFGRGGCVNLHPGNAKFRGFIRSMRATYQSAYRDEKSTLAQHVCNMVMQQDPPGRFLERAVMDGSDRPCYVIADPRKMIQKTLQALREQKWVVKGNQR